MVVLSAQDITKAYGENTILENVSFAIEEGERVGLVGPNGAGKTTLLRILCGELESDAGSVSLRGGCSLGYLEQSASLDTQRTVYEEMLTVFAPAFAMEARMRELEARMGEVHDADPMAYRQAANEYDSLLSRFEEAGGYGYKSAIAGVLTGLGLPPETHQQPIWQLSGGQRSRVALGKMLLTKPSLLLLDEPTNHLDLEAAAWLEGYLRSFPGAVLVVSHDRWFLDGVCQRMLELSFSHITSYDGNFSSYLEQREERYQQQLKAYQLNQKEIARKEAIIARYRSFNREKSIRAARSWEKKLEKTERLEKPQTTESMFFRLDTGRQSGNDVLLTENLSMAFGEKPLFSGLDLHLRAGDRAALIGPNGVGKTTLLRILDGQLRPTAGTFLLGAGVQVGYYDQQQALLDPRNTVLDEIWNDHTQMTHTQVRNALAAFLFRGEDVEKRVAELSGGEKGRLSLLKLMLNRGNLLLLDEPTNHLDIDSRQVLEEALVDFPGTVILVSHDRYFINRVANRIVEMNPDGFTQYPGNWEDYLYHQSLAKNPQPEGQGEVTRTALAKERRRSREQQERRRQLRAQCSEAEKQVTESEARLSALEEKLWDNTLSAQELEEASRDYAKEQALLEKLMARWEEISLRAEAEDADE